MTTNNDGIRIPGKYSLTVDNVYVYANDGQPIAFDSLDDARFAARMLCGATVVRWKRTDSGNGRTAEPVERIAAPEPRPMHGPLDLSAAPGRYLTSADLAAFRDACAPRGLVVSVGYNYSGPSIMQCAADGLRLYSLRQFESGLHWFTIKQMVR